MELRHLRYFVAVAEERHFGRAAHRLHMAQPPLSKQIRQLEAELGTPLLVRTTRRVELTPAGELLLERARRMLVEFDTTVAEVRQVGAGARGVVRVGFSGTATYSFMPALVQAMRRHAPALELAVQGEMLTPQMEAALEEGRLDAAVLRPPVRSAEISVRVIEHNSLALATAVWHPLASGGPIALDRLASESFVGYPENSSVNAVALEACLAAGFRPDIAQRARETSTLLSLVAAGVGLALVPRTVEPFAFPGVAFRDLVDAPAIDLAIAWLTEAEGPALRTLLELVGAAADEHLLPTEDQDTPDE